MITKFISVVSGALLLIGVSYSAGMWTTYKGWAPWEKVVEMQLAWRSYRVTGSIFPEDSFVRRDKAAPDNRYVVNDAAAVSPGLLVINRYDPPSKSYVLDLIDEQGEVVHTRPLEYSRIVDGGAPASFVHIATMLRDGSALVVFDDDTALARLDACGDPIWARTDQIYHHSIERGDDGYWTWQSAKWNGGHDQRMVKFDPENGDILESIDLMDDVINKSASNAMQMIIPEGFKFNRDLERGQAEDLFHPNDVKPLLEEIAAAFPQFSAGDLLISNRNMNMLAVIDHKTHEILWAQYGPWQHQHDADFQPDGTITVFSNNVDRFQSTIVQVDPKTGNAWDKFRGTGLDFDSFIMGKQQRLPNGNWLITVTMQGRVIEADKNGKIVRDYNNILNDKYNGVVLYAEHIAPDYLASIPNCDQ